MASTICINQRVWSLAGWWFNCWFERILYLSCNDIV